MPDARSLSRLQRRRMILRGLLRAAASTILLVALYFLAPFGGTDSVARVVTIGVALVGLLGVVTWQVRAITQSAHPRIRAVEALAVSVPLYLLVFASSYYVIADADPDSFSAQPLTRIDSLYFTVTVFSTVGFGDISPASQMVRLLVTSQMVLNLLVLGAGIQVFVAAVKRGGSTS